MASVPTQKLTANTEEFERGVMIDPFGFREYDARWLYPEQINKRGVIELGRAIGTMVHARGLSPQRIVVGHDYRSYSADIKHALAIGLMSSGCQVVDIGLALSPVAYFAQFALDCPAVAMVTASHNDNGWTGIKMGVNRPMTFGPDDIAELKDIALNSKGVDRPGGSYTYVPDLKTRYMADLTKDGPLTRKLKVVVACGNGTAGAYAPDVLRTMGCDVVELDCTLDYTFPRYNPNPEDMAMLHTLADQVRAAGADIGFAFDGDGDRCGVVDHTGAEIFADKIGVLLARDFATQYKNPTFVVDVKSTGLYHTDPVLKERGVKADYWKTGHSYIKRRVNEIRALAGFEKSGHFFFNAPIGRGYDDALLSAISVCRMLDRHPAQTLAQMKDSLPVTWLSPTMSPFCPEDKKYKIVDDVTAMIRGMHEKQEKILGQHIVDIITVNGVRFTLADGTWGLLRASSNKPGLIIVVESPISENLMHDMFEFIDGILQKCPDVGQYDQKLKRAA